VTEKKPDRGCSFPTSIGQDFPGTQNRPERDAAEPALTMILYDTVSHLRRVLFVIRGKL
jgi:hypothetical protein